MADVSSLLQSAADRALGREPGACGVAVLGGTFDPVHNGHVEVARAVLSRMPLAGLVVVPTLVSNFKRSRSTAPAADRLAMCALAFDDLPRCAVSDMEIRRGGVSYTADTLGRLAGLLPKSVPVSFVVGTDSLRSLPTWHRASEIGRLAQVVCVARAGEDLDGALAAVSSCGMGFRVHLIQAGVPDVSSTRVRAALLAGERADGMLPARVLSYIREHHLYREGE